MIRSLFPLLALVAGVFPQLASAQAGEINQRELACLTTALYAFSQQAEEAMTAEVLASELSNQVASSEAAGDYCKYVSAETQPPWETADLASITKAMREAERGSEEQGKAFAQLQAYQQTLNGYQTAQVVAFKMLSGWSFGMPVSKREARAAEAAAEAEAAAAEQAGEAAGSDASEMAEPAAAGTEESGAGETPATEPAGT